jgi:hypothetical protein
MNEDELCIHEMVPSHCTICLHGPTPRERAETAQCGSCEAPVIWSITEKGKRMPLNAEPSPSGRFRIVGTEINGTVHVHYVKNSELEANTSSLYDSHFASCPESRDWKRSR